MHHQTSSSRPGRLALAFGLMLVMFAMLALIAACSGDDAPARDTRCDACTASQRCLQAFDGTCQSMVSCVAPGTTCSAPYVADAARCGTEIAGALTCYGP